MTISDAYSKPERFTERKIAKRYRAAIHKCGLCLVCTHRDKHHTYFGMSICSVGEGRRHPQCETDGRPFKFTVDGDAIEQFKQGMKNAA